MLHQPDSAPASVLPAERRGAAVGRYCRSCHAVYPLLAPRHSGKPSHGKDHVASPCAHEGQLFAEGAAWWESAVEVLASPAAAG